MVEGAKGYRLDEIVAKLGGELRGDGARRVMQVATLSNAQPEQIAFLSNSKYQKQLQDTRAGAVVLAADAADAFSGPRIVTRNPYLYFARVSQLLNPLEAAPAGAHPSAVVESRLPASASVGANACIGPGCTVGEGARIASGCIIGRDVKIGAGARLHANVTVYDGCVIGERAILHSGAVIGSDGFGFAREDEGRWSKIPQIGRVIIGDDVEIGANTSIDRGAIDDTVIEDGVKLDNQIQIAHNCRIGAHTAIAGCVGIAGSTRIGRRCMIGGAAMIIGHLDICDDVVISAATFVTKSIATPGEYAGIPFEPRREWLKTAARLRQLDSMAAKIHDLEARLAGLEKKHDGHS